MVHHHHLVCWCHHQWCHHQCHHHWASPGVNIPGCHLVSLSLGVTIGGHHQWVSPGVTISVSPSPGELVSPPTVSPPTVSPSLAVTIPQCHHQCHHQQCHHQCVTVTGCHLVSPSVRHHHLVCWCHHPWVPPGVTVTGCHHRCVTISGCHLVSPPLGVTIGASPSPGELVSPPTVSPALGVTWCHHRWVSPSVSPSPGVTIDGCCRHHSVCWCHLLSPPPCVTIIGAVGVTCCHPPPCRRHLAYRHHHCWCGLLCHHAAVGVTR